MAVNYETKATNTGGRNGHVQTDDKAIDVAIVPPAQADAEKGTNPEQLFAAGYASCFNGAFDLILKQNQKIGEYGLSCNASLGTTAVALLLVENVYYIINVGDSRVYYLKEGMNQMTADQTFVQREMDLGRMTLEEAKIHPKRNILLQCVGASSVIGPDFYVGEYQPDSVFMMCSDGFRHIIQPQEFYDRLKPELMATEEKLKEAAVYFTELNKSRREEDNISVALIRAY